MIVELLLSGGLGGALIERLKPSGALVIAVSPLAAGDVSAELGADAFLQKPIDPVVLLSTVRDLLGTSALTGNAGAFHLVIERLPSGIAPLDRILSGGLVSNSINLVIGVPGSGKTILAQRYAFTNGTVERPALYISTVSEPLDKIVRFGQTLSFFDVQAVGNRVVYEDIGDDLGRGGLPAVTERIQTLLRERRPGVVVIDSFKAFTPYASDARDYRTFLHDLAGAASAVTGASFWLGEYGNDEVASAPEFAVADSVISLGHAHRRRSRGTRLGGAQAARQRLRSRTARLPADRRRPRRLPAPGRPARRLRLHHGPPARLDRHPIARRDARRRLLARLDHALRRPLGSRKNADGAALHHQRRGPRRTRRHRQPAGEPIPTRARGAIVLLGRSMALSRSCTARRSTSRSTNGSTSYSKQSNGPKRGGC